MPLKIFYKTYRLRPLDIPEGLPIGLALGRPIDGLVVGLLGLVIGLVIGFVVGLSGLSIGCSGLGLSGLCGGRW